MKLIMYIIVYKFINIKIGGKTKVLPPNVGAGGGT